MPRGVKVAQNRAHTPAMTSCAKCSNVWGGLKTVHCPACCATFTGIEVFDKHRTGSFINDTRRCLPPDSVGLVDAGRAYPCWGYPGRGGGDE